MLELCLVIHQSKFTDLRGKNNDSTTINVLKLFPPLPISKPRNKKVKEREDFEHQQLKACKSQTDHTQTTDFPRPPHLCSNFPIKIYIEKEADEIRDIAPTS